MSNHLDLTDPNSMRTKFRRKRVRHLVNFISRILESRSSDNLTICDLGGTYRYWLVFPFEDFNHIQFEISLVNLHQALKSEQDKYRSLIDKPNVTFKEEIGNGCDMNHIEENHFDICHSNSVIEHVGNWEAIKAFATETKRIGKSYFVQTPNYWFPIEPHYFLPIVHWLPRPLHTRMLMQFNKVNFDLATSYFDANRMLSIREFKTVFQEATFIKEKFYGLNKSFIAVSK